MVAIAILLYIGAQNAEQDGFFYTRLQNVFIKMSFQIIIPAVNIEMLDTLLGNILKNTLLPSSIIIINNSSQPMNPPQSSGVKFTVINPESPLYVNESWNLGISYLTECEFVSILNDDIEIPATFFERIHMGFKIPNAGAICPCTVVNKDNVNSFPIVDKYVKMNKKEGWAFSIRKDVLDKIPPIHSGLELFFGDDWFWWHIYRGGSGCLWYKDCGTVIYHAVGTALRKMCSKERNLQKKKEKFLWYDLKNEYLKSGVFNKGR